METITVKSVDIDGKEFILVDTIDKYNFFAEENDPENICILKEEIENGESILTSLDNDAELDKAFELYQKKYTNTN